MKNVFLISSIILLIACNNESEKLKQQNVALIERYIEAVKSKDLDVMSDLLADDYWGYGPSVSDSINKEQAVANWKNVAENLYDSIHFSRRFIIAAEVIDGPHPGHYVSSWVDMRITYKDGRGPVHLRTNTVYRIENNKITLTRAFYNEADVYRQLGYEF